MASTAVAPIGVLLREWRQRRNRSQLDLASEAEVSTRHLSCVETGKSKPSRELVLLLAEHLDVPLADRNELLLSAGYAPTFSATDLGAPEMAPVRQALRLLLDAHRDHPGVVFDANWDIVMANDAAGAFIAEADPAVLGPTLNLARISLHPDGLGRRIVNYGDVRAHLIGRLRRQHRITANPTLLGLLDEIESYPGPRVDPGPEHAAAGVIPVRLRWDDGSERAYLSTVTSFGSPVDVTVSELSIELFHPMDPVADLGS